MSMTPKDVAEIHNRLTEVLVQGAELKGEMKGIKNRLEEYKRPCDLVIDIKTRIESDRTMRANRELASVAFWDGVKSKVFGGILIVAILFVVGAVYFALRNGYTA